MARNVGYDPPSSGKTQKRLVIERDTEHVGLVVYRMHAPKRGDAIIELVATPPEHARNGAGGAAAALLEDELRRRGVRRIYAPAPAAHGIAMYFWNRLGYRPLLRGAWPCAHEGVAWLMRDLKRSP
jgi:hypothetical protein